MTENMKDRPVLPARRGPKPAPDERFDPVDIVAPGHGSQHVTAPGPSQVRATTPKKKREATIAIGPRISVSVMELLDKAVAEEGISQRQAIEDAIVARWGSK